MKFCKFENIESGSYKCTCCGKEIKAVALPIWRVCDMQKNKTLKRRNIGKRKPCGCGKRLSYTK